LTCWKAKSVLSARIIYQIQNNKKDKTYSAIRSHVYILNVDRQLSMEGGNLKYTICPKLTCKKAW